MLPSPRFDLLFCMVGVPLLSGVMMYALLRYSAMLC